MYMLDGHLLHFFNVDISIVVGISTRRGSLQSITDFFRDKQLFLEFTGKYVIAFPL